MPSHDIPTTIFLQGMGGQFEYFGLWLDQEFGPGHSKARPKCTTYGSPQLSALEEFQIEEIEVWGVGVPPEQEVGRLCLSQLVT